MGDWLGSDARIENSGTVYASGNAGGEAYSVFVEYGNGVVDNSGKLMSGVYLGSGGYDDDSSDLFLHDYSGQGVSLVNSGTVLTPVATRSFVGGDYTQMSGGELAFAVVDARHYGRIDIAGTADFTQGNVLGVQVDIANKLLDGDVLHNVIASDDLLQDGFVVRDDSVFWNFTAVVDGAYVDLAASKVAARDAVAPTGLNLTPSLGLLADGVLDEGADGQYAALAEALLKSPTAAAARDVLEHVVPVLSTGAAQATRMSANGVTNALQARLADARGAATGDALRDAGVWVKPFVGNATQDDASGVSGYDADTSGVVLGVDAAVSDDWRVGVALAAARSDAEGRISQLDIDTTQVSVYGSYAIDGRTSLDLSVSGAQARYDGSRRTIANSTALSSFDGTQLSVAADLSRRYVVGARSAFVPSLSLRFDQVNLDAYTETGAGLYNLAVQDATESAFVAAVKGAYEWTPGSYGTFSARVGAGYESADGASATASLSSGTGPTFVANGIEQEDALLYGGVGYRYVTTKGLEINAVYDLESRSDFQGQTASLKFKLPF